MIYPITPVPKPRMTRSDRWKKRPAVVRYWNFCDQIRQNDVKLPVFGAVVVFNLPMPWSWNTKKRQAHNGKPHQQRPDLSNLLKALEDACYGEDCCIWHYAAVEKRWAVDGSISIETSPEAQNSTI